MSPVPGLRFPEVQGKGWLQLDAWATAVFVVAGGLAAAFPDAMGLAFVVVSLGLFGAGIVVFFQGFLVGVDRSRTEEVSVAGLYFLMGGSAPRAVARWLMGLLLVQAAAAVAVAAVRPFTELAFGILVPMFGLAVAGRWAAGYGSFAARTVLRTKRAVRRPADDEGSPRA